MIVDKDISISMIDYQLSLDLFHTTSEKIQVRDFL